MFGIIYIGIIYKVEQKGVFPLVVIFFYVSL